MSEKLREALDRLANAADVYGADQTTADPRSGNVQPVTAEQGRELNEALAIAWAALAEPDVCVWRSVAMFYVTSCDKKLDQKAWDDLRNAGFTFPCCPGCGKRIEVKE